MTDRDTARAAKEELREELGRLPGVTGVGLGRREGDYVITVSVTEQAVCDHVPPHFHGVTVEVRVSGPVRALRGGADEQPAVGPAAPSRVTNGPVETPPSAAGNGREP